MVKTWSKLSKKDKKHLREMNIRYKWQFEDQVKFLKKEQNLILLQLIMVWLNLILMLIRVQKK